MFAPKRPQLHEYSHGLAFAACRIKKCLPFGHTSIVAAWTCESSRTPPQRCSSTSHTCTRHAKTTAFCGAPKRERPSCVSRLTSFAIISSSPSMNVSKAAFGTATLPWSDDRPPPQGGRAHPHMSISSGRVAAAMWSCPCAYWRLPRCEHVQSEECLAMVPLHAFTRRALTCSCAAFTIVSATPRGSIPSRTRDPRQCAGLELTTAHRTRHPVKMCRHWFLRPIATLAYASNPGDGKRRS